MLRPEHVEGDRRHGAPLPRAFNSGSIWFIGTQVISIISELMQQESISAAVVTRITVKFSFELVGFALTETAADAAVGWIYAAAVGAAVGTEVCPIVGTGIGLAVAIIVGALWELSVPDELKEAVSEGIVSRLESFERSVEWLASPEGAQDFANAISGGSMNVNRVFGGF